MRMSFSGHDQFRCCEVDDLDEDEILSREPG
jgi:hypothetical protein